MQTRLNGQPGQFRRVTNILLLLCGVIVFYLPITSASLHSSVVLSSQTLVVMALRLVRLWLTCASFQKKVPKKDHP